MLQANQNFEIFVQFEMYFFKTLHFLHSQNSIFQPALFKSNRNICAQQLNDNHSELFEQMEVENQFFHENQDLSHVKNKEWDFQRGLRVQHPTPMEFQWELDA